MKLFRIFIPVLLVSGWIMTSCDKLDPPYATVLTQYDTTNKPYILLEEYTGHTCNNCPLATQKALRLIDYYRTKVILMTVHATSLADPNPKYPLDLRTPEGTLWAGDYSISGVPAGTINRTAIGGSIAVPSDKWGEAIETQISKPIAAMVQLSASYSSSTREISASVSGWFKKKLTAGSNICLFITEDSIEGKQSNKDTAAGPTPEIDPYYFNETFRGSMNGNYGSLFSATVEVDKLYTYTKTFPVTNTDWNTNRLYLIAAILDPSASQFGEIIAVTKARIVSTK